MGHLVCGYVDEHVAPVHEDELSALSELIYIAEYLVIGDLYDCIHLFVHDLGLVRGLRCECGVDYAPEGLESRQIDTEFDIAIECAADGYIAVVDIIGANGVGDAGLPCGTGANRSTWYDHDRCEDYGQGRGQFTVHSNPPYGPAKDQVKDEYSP